MTLSAAWATVLTAGDTAKAAASVPRRSAEASPAPSPKTPSNASYSYSTFQFDVFVRLTRDVVAIRITVTNTGTVADDYKLSYIDNKTGEESRQHGMSLGAGQAGFIDLYGGLDRTFTAKVCPASTGNCVTVGPVSSSRS